MLHLLSLPDAPMPMTGRGSRPCGLAAGTLIRTMDGELPVEYLTAGDRVLTRGGGFATLRAVDVSIARDVDVVRFAPRAMGRHATDRALVVPVAQPVLTRDWRARVVYGQDHVLTPAGALVDDHLIRRKRLARLRLFRLHFDSPQVIRANGIDLASARGKAPTGTPLLH